MFIKNLAVSTKITTNVQIDKSQDKLSKKRQIELDSSGSSSDTSAKFALNEVNFV